MRLIKNSTLYTRGEAELSILAGWTAKPTHRSLEAEAAALTDIAERDAAARATFARRAAQ